MRSKQWRIAHELMWIVNGEIWPVATGERLLLPLIQIDEDAHEDQTYNAVDTKRNISAKVGSEKAAKQRATSSAKAEVKALQNTLTRQTQIFGRRLR